MRYRAQESLAERSAVQGTGVRLAELAPDQMARPKVSKWFTSKQSAFRFITRLETREPGRVVGMSAHRYTERDARIVVTYYGSPARTRVPLEKARLVMWHGLTVDRRLPVVVS